MSNQVVIIDNVYKKFYAPKRYIDAVNGISFDCHNGEIFGLLGTNGAGKTTLLRLLSSLMKPTSGRIEICGYNVEHNGQEVRRQIGVVSSNTQIYTKLTVKEAIQLHGMLHGMNKKAIKERYEELLSRLFLEAYTDTLVKNLSKGSQQKLCFACATIHNPNIYILDEPTSNLDILGARSVSEFILQSRNENKCIILSTHIMSEAEKLCDRIAVLHKGKMLAVGTLQELKDATKQKNLESIFFSLVQPERRG